MAYAGGAAAAAALAMANATKAFGVLVRVDETNFMTILSKVENPLVVFSMGGMFKKNYQYMVSYKGFAFFVKTETALNLPGKVEVIQAEQIRIPE